MPVQKESSGRVRGPVPQLDAPVRGIQTDVARAAVQKREIGMISVRPLHRQGSDGGA